MSASDSVTPRLYAEMLPSSHARPRTAAGSFFPGIWQACEIAVDFLACAAGMALVFWLQCGLHLSDDFHAQVQQDASICFAISLLVVFFLHRDGAYRGNSSLLQIRETERALRSSVQSVLVLLSFAFFVGLPSAASALFLALLLVPTLLITAQHVYMACARYLFRAERERNPAVLYGSGSATARVLSTLSSWLHPVMIVDENLPSDNASITTMGYRQDRFIRARRGPITAALLQSCRCNTLIIALQSLAPRDVNIALQAAEQAGVGVAFLYGIEVPEQMPGGVRATAWTKAMHIDGLLLVPQFGHAESFCYAIAKRALDLIVASVLLVLLSPLFLFLALLVKLDSAGPAIFNQERVGRNGKHFRMYKFRSMDTEAPIYDFSPATPSDPRITRIGRLLRRTSLDELPQLLNVVLGHMSLVGPRPEMPFIAHSYTDEQRQRLEVIPGITGMWQISAARAFPIHENIHYDFYYIRNRTFFMDLAILVHTLLFALRGGV